MLGLKIVIFLSLCLSVSVVNNKKPGAAEMVSQVRAYEYLLLINDIHGPRGAFHDNEPDRFRSLCNGG